MIADMQQEHRRLLTAQMLLTDRVDRLVEAQRHTEERLTILIDTVDAIIPGSTPSRRPRP